MSNVKKLARLKFRDAVFARDRRRCRVCGSSSGDWRKSNRGTVTGNSYLDAHHITDRHLMPNGGYVLENGISLCPDCHEKAESFHSSGVSLPGMSPDDLYALIGSSYEKALEASKRDL